MLSSNNLLNHLLIHTFTNSYSYQPSNHLPIHYMFNWFHFQIHRNDDVGLGLISPLVHLSASFLILHRNLFFTFDLATPPSPYIVSIKDTVGYVALEAYSYKTGSHSF